ncbi:TRAP transporter large permease subunit [Chloroflexota bacterium]
MEWQFVLLVVLGILIVLMLTGMPVAFSFLLIGIIGAFIFFGGEVGMRMLATSIRDSVADFILIPVVLFVLMGEVMFQSRMAGDLIHTVGLWIGRVPGRLSLLATGSGAVLAFLTGVSMASTAILGELLVPQMEEQGYKKPMTLGPILGAGGLAIMIPPSGLAVLAGALAEESIGRILVGIIIPGLLMAALYTAYIIIRCWLQPDLAPTYQVPPVPFKVKMAASVKYILPLGAIVFLVTGVIIMGIATPSEAAATGALGMFGLVAFYGRLNWKMLKKSLSGTVEVSIMLLMIIAASTLFSQILSISGAARGAVQFAMGLPLAPILILIAMQLVVLILGMFISVVPIMMITIPLFIPLIRVLGFDPVWFLIIFLLNIEMATTSPPFGLGLFVMKGVAPKGTTIGDCYRAALPFLACDVIAMALIIIYPGIALWLPGVMR